MVVSLNIYKKNVNKILSQFGTKTSFRIKIEIEG